MKKIFLLIVLFISVAVSGYAQIKDGGAFNYEFNLGDYKFTCPMQNNIKAEPRIGGEFKIFIDDDDEAVALYKFIRDNKTNIEDKYDIVIEYYGADYTKKIMTFNNLMLVAYTRTSYIEWKEKQDALIAQKNEARDRRLQSLETIIFE